MKRILLILFGLVLGFPAIAADNAVILTPGVGVTMRTKDIGAGVQSPFNILGDTSGASIYGTAGSPNAVVLSVQGVVSGNTLPVTITGTVPVSIASTVTITQSTANVNVVSAVGATQGITVSNLTVSPIAVSNNAGLLTVPVGDPCQTSIKSYKTFAFTSTTTQNIVTGTALKKIYICHLFLTSAGANNVSVIDGITGGTCSSALAVIGSTTPANGPNFTANGGYSIGNGGYSIAATNTNNNDLCFVGTAATPTSGSLTYAVQ